MSPGPPRFPGDHLIDVAVAVQVDRLVQELDITARRGSLDRPAVRLDLVAKEHDHIPPRSPRTDHVQPAIAVDISQIKACRPAIAGRSSLLKTASPALIMR